MRNLQQSNFFLRDVGMNGRSALLLLNVFLIILLWSCTPALYFGLKKEGERKITENEIRQIFNNSSKAYKFKTKIWIYGKYFSGVLAIKFMENNSYRTIFMNETGFKIFDIEFFPDSTTGKPDIILHHCLESFNNKALINTISNDLRLLFINYLPASANIFLSDKTGCTVYRFKKGKEHCYYYKDNSNGAITKIEKTGRILKKVIVYFKNYEVGDPHTIFFRHKNIRLKIELVGL
ncbi:MAG: hypothetical protein HY738_17385 [Bacteroidia bacterium]|nr:hypothetical protein [Bacteroidia bacterium]